MAKPPSTPPSSDISGVDRDKHRITDPANVDAKDNEQIGRRNQDAKARPLSGSGSEAIGD